MLTQRMGPIPILFGITVAFVKICTMIYVYRERVQARIFNNLDSIVIKRTDPHDYYDNHKDYFCNKCDHDFYRQVLKVFECCENPEANFLMGGLNNGDLADIFLSECKGNIHGFEIQKDLYEGLLLKYAGESRIFISNQGMSSRKDKLPVTGDGEGAGTYQTFRNITTWDGKRVARVTDLASYIDENRVEKICMVHIDVEGHEPEVIQGLQLNKNRIPVVIYELGGTWVDSRHESIWSQADTAKYLIQHGYSLFIIGKSKMMEIDDKFFERAKGLNEGFGNFIQGNLLALLLT